MKTMIFLLCLVPVCVMAGELSGISDMLVLAASVDTDGYIEVRKAIADIGAPALPVLGREAENMERPWQQRLVARICYERIMRGADIQDLRKEDWSSYPPYQPRQMGVLVLTEMPDGTRSAEMRPSGASVGIPRSGPSYLMDAHVIPHCQKMALWYYFIELTWKQTGEGPLNIDDPKFIERWPTWCRMALSGRPEEVYLFLTMTDRLEKDELLEAADATQLYRELLNAQWPEAVPVLVRRYDAYNKRKVRGPEVFPGSQAITFRGMFQPILDTADHRHAELLEVYMTGESRLAELLPALADVRGRAAAATKAELSFSLDTVDEK